MIIFDKYKCIFIRIPKTGSTSVETLFKKIDPDCISSDEEKIYLMDTFMQVNSKIVVL